MSSLKSSEINHGPYTVRRFSPELYPFEIRLGVFRVSHSLSWSLWLLHVVYDMILVLQVQRDGFCNTWKLWIAILAEFFLTFPEALAALDIALGLFSGRADQPRAEYELCGEAAPAVDVMITCCGEPVPVIMNTIKAATAQTYPGQRFRIFVLDDGRDQALQAAVESFVLDLERTPGPTLKYLSRTKELGTGSYFKSGNLRFGIEASQPLHGGSEFLAGLDADMIVDPDWLRKMVPHLILNDHVACVCGPQVRYASTGDPLLAPQTAEREEGDK